MKLMVVLSAAALAAACGRGEPAGTASSAATTQSVSSNSGESGNAPDTASGGSASGAFSPGTSNGSNAGATPCDGKLTVRIVGVNAGTLQELDLRLAGVSLRAASGTLPIEFSPNGHILLPAGSDGRLAVLQMPTGVVDVTVLLEQARICSDAKCTDLDLCTSPIEFSFDAAKVSAQTCHVVLRLDVANSVQSAPDGSLAFLPQFAVVL